MAVLANNAKLIKVGQDYSAGSGISIDDHVISVTGEFGKTYSAGDNISIYEQDEQLYISSKDWTNDIANASANAYNEAVSQIPDPFDPTFISGQVDNKLDTTAFTAWQNGQYNTDLQTIEGQISNKLDESAFSQVSASFLTAINIPESATWNEVSQAYEQASGTYLTSVSIPESATWNDVSTTVQTNSAQWSQGGGSTSGLVSGTNVVKVPDYEGSTHGQYWSACISGDVKVAYGNYFDETDLDERDVYSLSAICGDICNKLNKNTLENSKTIKSFNDVFEVYDVAYKRTNFTNGSAYRISIEDAYTIINFDSDGVAYNSNLYSASITAETTATGNISYYQGEWKVVDFSNGSAILTAIYPVGISNGHVDMDTNDGWGPITNCEAICTVYTSAELAPLAFKDDIPSGGGGVPQSAFDELKASYDALSSLFATYSGQWLLPNEGEE